MVPPPSAHALPPVGAPVSPPALLAAKQASRVLLVDDDAVCRMITALALRERGFDVTEASCGISAMALLASAMPDIMVVDACMPGMDGFDTCKAVRATASSGELPILMLTGLDDEDSIARAHEAGATDFFIKSAPWTLLAGRLSHMLRAASTRLDLERNRADLSRAQDLARMGGFHWRAQSGWRFSQEAVRVLGLEHSGEAQRVSLHALMRMTPKPDRRGFMQQLQTAIAKHQSLALDLVVNSPKGMVITLRMEAEPDFAPDGSLLGFTGIVQDISERREAEHRIQQLAHYDPLTGLPNRRQLLWRAQRAVDAAKRNKHHLALLLVDLDRFKVINDTLGHAAGDDLLSEVASRLRACVRHTEHVPELGAEHAEGLVSCQSLEGMSRSGGDEFVALLPEVCGDADVRCVADRVQQALQAPFMVFGQEVFVSASVGYAVFPADGQTVSDLLRNADIAKHAAKSQGRSMTVAYVPHLAGRGRERLALESALHKALERGELVLHYQPKVDVRVGEMVGVEALMRWHREGQLVPPGDFIPLAEETGLIVPMSTWALAESARQAARWRQAFGFSASIAVNLPTRLFERTDLVDCIRSSVDEVDMPSSCVQLEVTESGVMRELERVLPTMQRLKDAGVAISIDDFGTGYSSLAYLTSLPIAELKIDRSFVREMERSQQSTAVVSAILALARALNLRVVAEGVETVQQMDALHRLGCHIMQGFLFSKGVTSSELERWVMDTMLPRKAAWMAVASSSPIAPHLAVVAEDGQGQRRARA